MSRTAMPSTQSSATDSPLRDLALVVWGALGALLPCLAPNVGPAVLVLSVVAPVLLADRAVLMHNVVRVGPVTRVLAIAVLYLMLNVALATVTDNASGAIAVIALIGLVTHLCAASFPAVKVRDLKLLARGLVIGGFVVAIFLCVEYLAHMSVLRTLQHAAASARLAFIRIDAGTWDSPSYIYLSRNLIVLIMMTWAILAFVWIAGGKLGRQIAIPALLLLVAVAAHLSPSSTAKAGLLAGAGAWVLAWTLPRLAAILLTAGWSVASLACIPISHVIHRYGLYDLDVFNASLRHRMMIWSASAEWYWKHPIFGVGVGGARKLNLNDTLHLTAKGIEGEPLNWHAHNIFVQAWFETGAVGGLILCLLGLVILRAIFRLPGTIRPFAVATFASIFVIGLTGFSLWAAWYLAGYGLAGLCILLAVFISRDEAPLPGPAAG